MKNESFDTDILLQIRHLSKCLRQDIDSRLESYGLTGQQGRILFCVNRSYEEKIEIHQNDLEEYFHLSKSSVSEIVSIMVAGGLIEKISAKPYYALVPTEKGHSIVDEIFSHKNETIATLFDGFTEDEVNAITKSISKMISNLTKEEK